MDIVMWILAGGVLGCLGYSYLGFNEARGVVVSAIIGACGGLLGGKMIAPMFSAGAVAGGLNVSGLFFAAVVAAAFLVLGDMVHRRWHV